MIIVLTQGFEVCSPKGRDCIENLLAETFNCSMTCDGMYADISWKEVEIKGTMDKDKHALLSSEYENFKRKYVKHFEFSSSSDSVMFGEQKLS